MAPHLTQVNAVQGAEGCNEPMKPNGLICSATVLSLAATALGAAEFEAADSQTDLEPITVTAPVSPLDRQQQLLRILVERSTPCLGCDAVLRQSPPAPTVAFLHQLLAHPSPNDVDAATRLASDVRLHDSPDLEYLQRP